MKRAFWKLAAADMMLLAAEAGLILLAYGRSLIVTGVALFIDICMLSPLKAGVALLADTIQADPENACFRLFFRYCSHGYGKSIRWRLLLWLRMAGMALFCAIPVMLLSMLEARSGDDQLVRLFFTVCRYFVMGSGVAVLLITMVRLSPAVYLLPHTATASEAFAVCKQTGKGKLSHLLSASGYFFLLPYHQLRYAQAVRRLSGAFLKKKWSHTLQDTEKHGMINKISTNTQLLEGP